MQDAASPDVQTAFDLFVDVWKRERDSAGWALSEAPAATGHDDAHYFDGIADDFWRSELDQSGVQLGWDWDRINAYFDARDWARPRLHRPHLVWPFWPILMTDPRYLHL